MLLTIPVEVDVAEPHEGYSGNGRCGEPSRFSGIGRRAVRR